MHPFRRSPTLRPALIWCGGLGLFAASAACGEVRADAVVLGSPTDSPTGSAAGSATGLGGATNVDTSTAGEGGTGNPSSDEPGNLDAPSIAGDVCSPCTRSSECGGEQDYCLEFRGSDGRFCGKHCYSDRDCPDGYDCVTLRNEDEEQCVPKDRSCSVDVR